MCVQGHFLASFLLAVPFCLATSSAATFSDANWISIQGLNAPNNSVRAAVVDALGNLYIGGNFWISGVATDIAKWNGSSWSALGSGISGGNHKPIGACYALAVSGSDLYVGGHFTRAGGIQASHIAKWNGTNWSALGSGVSDAVVAVAVSGSNLYAGGGFTTAGGAPVSRIAKWDGGSWAALGSGMGGGFPQEVLALAVSGSNLYAGGYFTTAGGNPVNRIAKWDGSSWSALGSGANSAVRALAILGGELYAGGDFTTAGGRPAANIAKWDGSSWSALGSGMNGEVDALAVSGKELYAGGVFTTAGGNAASRIAKWGGTSWSALGSGMNFSVSALAVSRNHLYVGGHFTTAGDKASVGVAKARIASAAESITASGSSTTIQFTGVVGYQYHVQRTDTLTPPMTWTTLTTTPLSPADDGSLTFTDTTAPLGTAYYRLVQHSP